MNNKLPAFTPAPVDASGSQFPPPNAKTESGEAAKLTWTTKPGSARADSNVAGYWITWTAFTNWQGKDGQAARWFNGWVKREGRDYSPPRAAGADLAKVKAACQAHYETTLKETELR